MAVARRNASFQICGIIASGETEHESAIPSRCVPGFLCGPGGG